MDKEVTREEFFKELPEGTVGQLATICEPPVSLYIFGEQTLGKIVHNTAMKGHPCYDGEPDKYYLKELD